MWKIKTTFSKQEETVPMFLCPFRDTDWDIRYRHLCRNIDSGCKFCDKNKCPIKI